MDKQAAERLITNTFDYPFDIGKYKLLSRNIFKEFEEAEFIREGTTYIPEGFRSHIKKYERLGKYEDDQGRVMDILIVYINEGVGLDKARTLQRNFIANYLDDRGKDAALVAFTTSDMEDWRFSLITIEYKTIQDESGKVKTKKVLSNAKRFSFLVGKNEANHTAQQQVIPLLTNNNNPSIEDLEQAFSVEQVTNEFYQEYKKRFLELGYEINRVLDKDEKIKKEFAQQNISTENFAKKLMGQIVFLYFVQKKGWLGVGKDDDGNFLKWGEGDRKFMRSLFEKKFCKYDNYFNDVLEPLFYEALATERANNYYSNFECKIPFLSGGLFEPMNGYNWQETDITISNNVIEMILDTFDRYNFTVKEDDPLDKEVAIDPEMLGKVFENLLPENLKKGNGAFYTPRPIVHYMCQESLINYLDTHLDIDKKHITLLVKEGEAVVEHDKIANTKEEGYEGKYQKRMPNSIIENAREIDNLLTYVKICDPAIGSGAFPMGLLHEIVVARNILTTYIGNEYGRTKYKLKSDCIQNSIYGVDIDEGAIEISKLRLWLSLIVDEDDIENIKPLPNLDYKIMYGNSLISRYALDSPIDVVFSEFNKKVKSKDYKNTDIRNLVGNQEVDLRFYKNITNDFLYESSHNKKILFRELIGEIKKAFKTELNDKDRAKLSEVRGVWENLSRIDIFGQVAGTQTEINKAKKKLEKLEKSKQETQDGKLYKNAVEWRFEFPNLLNDSGEFMGFDIVIANPPYGSDIDNEVDYFKKKFPLTTKGFKDIYKIFYNLGLEFLLKENGVISYITPNTFMLQPRYEDLRSFMLQYNIQTLLNLGEEVFKEVVVPTAIIIIKKENKSEILEFADISVGSKYNGKINDVKFHQMSQNDFEINYGKLFANNIRGLKADEVILDKILDFKDAGINYQRVNVGLSNKGKSDLSTRLLYESEFCKQENHIMYWKGTDMESFYIEPETNRYVIPDISLNDNERIVLNREYFSVTPKIIWKQTAQYPIAAIDNIGIWFGRSIQAGLLKIDYKDKIKYEYLICLLNSDFLRSIYSSLVKEGGRVFPQVKLAKIKPLPIKVISLEKQIPFVNVTEKIMELKQQKEDVKELLFEMNQMVYKLYQLTYEEVLIVDEAFAMSEVEYNNFEL